MRDTTSDVRDLGMDVSFGAPLGPRIPPAGDVDESPSSATPSADSPASRGEDAGGSVGPIPPSHPRIAEFTEGIGRGSAA